MIFKKRLRKILIIILVTIFITMNEIDNNLITDEIMTSQLDLNSMELLNQF